MDQSIFQRRHDVLDKAYTNLIHLKGENKPETILAYFLDFYINYWHQITNLTKREQSNVVVGLIKKYNEKKKEIDAILDNYKNKNRILPGLKKRNLNANNLAKNLANKVDIENNVEKTMTQAQQDFNNNKLLKKVGINKIQELYKPKNRSNSSNSNILLKKEVNTILNNKAKRLSEIKALELKQKLTNLSEEEKNKLASLSINSLSGNMKNLRLQPK